MEELSVVLPGAELSGGPPQETGSAQSAAIAAIRAVFSLAPLWRLHAGGFAPGRWLQYA